MTPCSVFVRVLYGIRLRSDEGLLGEVPFEAQPLDAGAGVVMR
jgi:hypothetical protein